MSILSISQKLNIGVSGIRYLLQREGIDSKKYDEIKFKQRYDELIKNNIRKIKIYEILSNKFELLSGYIEKKIKNN